MFSMVLSTYYQVWCGVGAPKDMRGYLFTNPNQQIYHSYEYAYIPAYVHTWYQVPGRSQCNYWNTHSSTSIYLAFLYTLVYLKTNVSKYMLTGCWEMMLVPDIMSRFPGAPLSIRPGTAVSSIQLVRNYYLVPGTINTIAVPVRKYLPGTKQSRPLRARCISAPSCCWTA